MDKAHLLWIVCGALAGFASSFVFGDLLNLPVDLYYLIYFAILQAIDAPAFSYTLNRLRLRSVSS